MSIFAEKCYVAWCARSLLVGSLLAFPAGVSATNDPLLIPAVQSQQSQRALMLDITLAGTRLIAVGERGFILYSDDQGSRWEQAEVPVQETLTGVHFSTPDTGWVVGHAGVLLRSDDGGRRWHKVLDGNGINRLQLDALTDQLQRAKEALAAADGQQHDALQERTDELEMLLGDAQMFAEEGPTRPLLGIWFDTPLRGFLLGAFGLFLTTDDGGVNWRWPDQPLPNPDGFHLHAMTRLGDQLFLCGEAGTLYRSDDGGRNWQVLESPYEGSLHAIAGQGNTLIVAGLRGHAYRSNDGGDSWDPIALNHTAAVSDVVWLSDQRVAMTAYNGQILVSDDRGASINQRLTAGPAPLVAAAATTNSLWLAGPGGLRSITVESIR